jgi:hypothetical protein
MGLVIALVAPESATGVGRAGVERAHARVVIAAITIFNAAIIGSAVVTPGVRLSGIGINELEWHAAHARIERQQAEGDSAHPRILPQLTTA